MRGTRGFFFLTPLIFFCLGLSHTPTRQPHFESQGSLELGKIYQRTIESGAVQAWNLILEAGHYAVVQVTEENIDVAVRVVDEAGVTIVEFR